MSCCGVNVQLARACPANPEQALDGTSPNSCPTPCVTLHKYMKLLVTCTPSVLTPLVQNKEGSRPAWPTTVLWSMIQSSVPIGPCVSHPFGPFVNPWFTQYQPLTGPLTLMS